MARERAQRPEPGPLRLFVAIDVPEDAQRAVGSAVTPIREAFPQARWAPRENWHVTLKFLGSTDPSLVRWVDETVARIASAHAPVRTVLTSLGSFPSATRTRVLWAGVDDPSGELAALAAALDEELAAEFPPQTRAFSAHVTVARSDPPLRLDPAVFAIPFDAPLFTIDRLVLYRSHLGRPAPRYEALRSFPLLDPA